MEFGDDLAEVKILKVDAFEYVGHFSNVEVVAEFGGELAEDVLNVHRSGVKLLV